MINKTINYKVNLAGIYLFKVNKGKNRYSKFCNFFPLFPHFPDSKGQMEVE